MQNQERKVNISQMLFLMSQAILKEAAESNDLQLVQLSGMLSLASTCLHNEADMFVFSELCSMFSAKMILDGMKDVNPNTPISDIIKRLGDEDFVSQEIQSAPRIMRKRIPVKKKKVTKKVVKKAAVKKVVRKKVVKKKAKHK